MSAASPPPAMTTSKRIASVASVVVAFGLLAFVIHRNGGVATIAGVVARLGYRWPLLLVPYALNAVTTIMAYRNCLPRRGRDVPFMTLVQIERSGSALNAFLPLGDSSGSIIKVALLRHWYSSHEIVAASVWSSLATGVGNGISALGPLIAYAMGVIPGQVALLLSGVAFVMMIPSVTVMFLVRRGLAVRAAATLSRLPINAVRSRKERIIAWAKSLDENVASAVTTRFSDFLHVVGWRALYQIIRIGELWLVIWLLGLSGGIAAALVYNAMSRAIQQLFGFIPGRMGVVEGVSAVLSSALGWSASAAVGMSLTLRFSYIVNLFLSGSALSGTHALSQKYPPRDAETIRAAMTGAKSTP